MTLLPLLPLVVENIIMDYVHSVIHSEKMKKIHKELINNLQEVYYKYYTVDDHDSTFTNDNSENGLVVYSDKSDLILIDYFKNYPVNTNYWCKITILDQNQLL